LNKNNKYRDQIEYRILTLTREHLKKFKKIQKKNSKKIQKNHEVTCDTLLG